MRSDRLLSYWQWMRPFVQLHERMVPMMREEKVFDRLDLDVGQ